ncbi:GAL4-like transcription factor-like protein [Massarina eburnea CBS 473.64]|uniref:GAL4-like transcription factor-like protein n=1 Tax=Massarina eburnea CBS 473.64 TaxID=1395130 RepID=A0A6A6RFY7_9PLEO|nr:GAL4-like transcription factor-like protein [Massarina eburnea CBS 473.64]
MENRASARVRRRVLACARCRKRKLSCDGKVPSCTRCTDAGVSCVGFDSSTQKEAPRSIADYLERLIASLENPKSPTPLRRPGRPSVVFPSPAASHDSDPFSPPGAVENCTFADGLVNRVMEDITPSFLGISKVRPILSCVVNGTQLPSRKGPVGSNDLDENHPRSIINPQPSAHTLDRIDHKTASGLFHNYLDRIITQYPIYHRNHVTAAFNSIYYPASNPGHDSPRHRYIVSIIMAISLSTAARTQQKKANSVAYGLVRQAMQYIPEVATNDISGLQAILLLTQYTFLNPSTADVWLLTGLISQAVIDLGLHQELPNRSHISPYERDMRRRLFWCAWEMEVGVCCIFQRPVNLPTRRIDVAFPVEVDDVSITKAGIDLTGRISKFTSRRICLFRTIEADIFAVLRHGEPIPKECTSIEHWMQRCHNGILEWQNDIRAAAQANEDPAFEERWKEMCLYSEIAVPYILVALYRPTPANPSPTTEQLLAAFVNTVKVADGYWQQINADFGRIKYVFHPCHHVFNCADVFLRILQRCKQEISETYELQQIEYWTSRFSACFLAIAERWTVATRCLTEYERELAVIMKEYTDFLNQKASYVPQRSLPTTPMGDTMGSLVYNYPAPPPDDEALNFWNVFTTTSDTVDTVPPVNLPHDWAAEFNLDLVPVPDMDQKFIPPAQI